MVGKKKIRRFLFLLLVLLCPLCAGCQRMVPKLPEEKEVGIEDVLRQPSDFQKMQVKTKGILLALPEEGLVLKDMGETIRVSTSSSGIDCGDFLQKKVEVGGKIKVEGGKPILELDWIGLAFLDEGWEVAEDNKLRLAEALNLRGDIEIVSVEPVNWPDTSLGVPEEGKIYPQVITPGFKIIYRAEGKAYEVHTNQDGTLAVLVTPRKEL